MTARPMIGRRWVESHMGTVVTLAGSSLDDEVASRFFARIAELETLLSRYRITSQVTLLALGELHPDDAAPELREVLARCEAMRELTRGDFEFQPRRRTADPNDPILDVNAVAKGWIIEEAAMPLRIRVADFFVNAGGDVLVTTRHDGAPWRIGVQHPVQRDAVVGVLEVPNGAVATSGTYERGPHIRSYVRPVLQSATVVGPDLATADALSTALFASGSVCPPWWGDVHPMYGALTVSLDNRLRWMPALNGEVECRLPPHEARDAH